MRSASASGSNGWMKGPRGREFHMQNRQGLCKLDPGLCYGSGKWQMATNTGKCRRLRTDRAIKKYALQNIFMQESKLCAGMLS